MESEVNNQRAHVLQTDIPPHSELPSVQGGEPVETQVQRAELRHDVLRAEAMVRLAIGYTMHVLGVDKVEFVDDGLTKFADQHQVELTTKDGISTYLIKSRNEERN